MNQAAAAALCLTSIALGCFGANRLKRRLRTLELLLLLLRRLELELRFSREMLPDLLLRLAQEPPFNKLGLLTTCSAGLLAGETLSNAWRAGVEALGPLLGSWQKTRLLQLGTLLGATDLDGQTAALGQTTAFLQNEQSDAMEKYQTNARLWRGVGAFFGVTLFIMVL